MHHCRHCHSQVSVPGAPGGSARGAFSLIEVVAAVAIFAIGMVGVLGLFGPVTKSAAAVGDAEAAARVADAVTSRLKTIPFNAALALIQDPATISANDADGSYNPADGIKHPAVIFGGLSGEAGIYEAERNNWRDSLDRTVPDTAKFFEIDLIRNEVLSPVANDPTSTLVAFTMRVRWPAFVQTASNAAIQNGQNLAGGPVPYDQSKKQVLFFTGFITR